MIPVDCDTCKLRGRCRMFSAQHRVTLLAWAKGVPAPICKDYQPRWFRGIEGVIDCSASPRPTTGDEQRNLSS